LRKGRGGEVCSMSVEEVRRRVGGKTPDPGPGRDRKISSVAGEKGQKGETLHLL